MNPEVERLVEQGKAKSDAEKFSEAVELFSRAIKLDPRCADAYSGRAYALGMLDKNSEALADHHKTIELQPDDPFNFSARAISRWLMEDHEGALADLAQAIRLDPEQAHFYDLRAGYRQEKGDFDGAIADWTEFIRRTPGEARGFAERASAKAEKGDLPGAMIDIDRAVEMADYPHAVYRRGTILRDHGRYAEAIVDFTKAIQIDSETGYYYHARGSAKSSAGDFRGAIEDFKRARELDSELFGLNFEMGLAYYLMGQSSDALPEIESDCPPDDLGTCCFYRWIIHVRQGRREAGSKILEACMKKSEEADEWMAGIARLLLGQGSEEELLHVIEEEVSRDTPRQQCSAYFFAGAKRFLDGDRAGAVERWKKCVALPVHCHSELDSARAHLKECEA